MNDFAMDQLMRIMLEAETLCYKEGKSMMTSREIQTVVRLIYPGEVAKHGVSEGTKAVTKYHAAKGEDGKQRSSQSVRAGLTMPVARLHRIIKEHCHFRVGVGAPVYAGAVLEYLIAEILELAGNAARDNKRIRIIPRHLMLAVRNDEELNKIHHNVIISAAGVIPSLHSILLPNAPRGGEEEDPAHQSY